MMNREYSDLYKSWARHLKNNRLFVRWCFYIKRMSYVGRTLTSPIGGAKDFILNGPEIPFHASMTKTENTEYMKFLMMMMARYEHTASKSWYEMLASFLEKVEKEKRIHKKKYKGVKKIKNTQQKWYNKYYKKQHYAFNR